MHVQMLILTFFEVSLPLETCFGVELFSVAVFFAVLEGTSVDTILSDKFAMSMV